MLKVSSYAAGMAASCSAAAPDQAEKAAYKLPDSTCHVTNSAKSTTVAPSDDGNGKTNLSASPLNSHTAFSFLDSNSNKQKSATSDTTARETSRCSATTRPFDAPLERSVNDGTAKTAESLRDAARESLSESVDANGAMADPEEGGAARTPVDATRRDSLTEPVAGTCDHPRPTYCQSPSLSNGGLHSLPSLSGKESVLDKTRSIGQQTSSPRFVEDQRTDSKNDRPEAEDAKDPATTPKPSSSLNALFPARTRTQTSLSATGAVADKKKPRASASFLAFLDALPITAKSRHRGTASGCTAGNGTQQQDAANPHAKSSSSNVPPTSNGHVQSFTEGQTGARAPLPPSPHRFAAIASSKRKTSGQPTTHHTKAAFAGFHVPTAEQGVASVLPIQRVQSCHAAVGFASQLSLPAAQLGASKALNTHLPPSATTQSPLSSHRRSLHSNCILTGVKD